MQGYIYVDPPSLNSRTVRAWLRLPIPHVLTLPPKPAGQKPRRAKGEGDDRQIL